MSAQLSKRTSLALLVALALALAFGLLAAGPWLIRPDTLTQADQRTLLGLPGAMNVFASLPLVGAGLWGLASCMALRPGSCPATVRLPMGLFFALGAAAGSVAVAYHLQPAAASFVLGQVLLAGVCAMLMLAFLAERVQARLGHGLACLATLALCAAGGAVWWWCEGDIRLLAWVQALPVLLLSAGMLVLPCGFSRNGDWLAMLLIYVAARVADLADGALLSATGLLSGHTLMHLGVAAAAGLMAWRVWTHARGQRRRGVQDEGSGSGPASLRSTSLHTAG
jgi:hypothetical protein